MNGYIQPDDLHVFRVQVSRSGDANTKSSRCAQLTDAAEAVMYLCTVVFDGYQHFDGEVAQGAPFFENVDDWEEVPVANSSVICDCKELTP